MKKTVQPLQLDITSLANAIAQLEQSLMYYHSEIVQQDPGLVLQLRAAAIQAFEFTYELAWKTMQDYLQFKGYDGIVGPRPVIEQSFQMGLIEDGLKWMEMLIDRNLTTHTYDHKTTLKIIRHIRKHYVDLFTKLYERLKNEK